MATRLTTHSDWLAANPPRGLTATLADVAGRVQAGEDFNHAVCEFLDEFALRDGDASRAGGDRRSARLDRRAAPHRSPSNVGCRAAG
jgi:hypothetical protein